MGPSRFALAAVVLPALAARTAFGVQVATVRGPVPAPGGLYTLHAVVPTPASVTGPLFVGGFPTESHRIGGTLTQNYHEVFGRIPSGATGPFPVNTEGVRPDQSFLVPAAVSALINPKAIVLAITDVNGDVYSFPLTGVIPSARLTVNNYLAKTGYGHVALGQFGDAHVWMTLRADLSQIDVILNWHTGVPGTQDVLFKNARIICSAGAVWIPNLADPVGSQTASRFGYLVKPTGSGLPHIIPQRHERPFRFSVLPASAVYKQPWAWNGMANWNVDGAFPLGGFATPGSISGADLDAEATTWRNGLLNLTPWHAGGPPVSALWPAAGGTHGGLASGIDMAPFDGVRWLVTGQVSGFERFATEQLRMRSRMRGCLFESNGDVVKPWQHLNNGMADWRMYNSVWERPSSNQFQPLDGQFDFPVNRLLAQAAYNPEVFDPTDCRHLVREWNHNAVLAMAAADPLAMHYLKMEAAKSLMTYWYGPGNANRFGPAPQAGRGIEMDRGWDWAAMVIAHNYVWSPPIERAQYDPWINKVIDYLKSAQMPSGMFGIYPAAKESRDPPYSTTVQGTARYIIDSGLDECYFAGTLSTLTNISAYAAAATRAPQMLRKQAVGFKDLAWAIGRGGAWYAFAVGPNDGSGTRYRTRADWPADLAAAMTANPNCETCPDPDGSHVGYAVAAFRQAGSPHANELLFRYTRRSTVAQALALMASWGTGGNGTPVEQFWPAIGEFSQP